ncbi:MAG: glycosyltransferase family 4 protein [bacterium]
MNILFLTQYYPPEVGAPQNRISELAVRFRKEGNEVEVLTAMPNYPHMEVFEGYRGRWYLKEEADGVTIHRAAIFVTKNTRVWFRLMTYFSFVFTSFWVGWTRLKRFDLIICESPPLFLGITAVLLKRLKGAKLVFNISDLWPESAEKLGLIKNRFFLRISTTLEEFLYRNSDLITGQTQGIIRNISARFPEKNYFWLKNGVDLNFYRSGSVVSDWRKEEGISPDDFIVFYGGILGYAQGLEVVLQAARMLEGEPGIRFILAGEGPVKSGLMRIARDWNLANVTFLPAFPKSRMPEVIHAINVSVIPLKKLELFRGAIPSKIFENLAMKKPILLGVEGEAKALFIDEGQCGLAYTPEDAADLVRQLLRIRDDRALYHRLSENAYIYAVEHFDREQIFRDFQEFLQRYLNATGNP